MRPFLLPFFFLIFFLSCGQGQSPLKERTTIVFKHFKVAMPEALEELVKNFEKKNPDIKVKEEILPASSDEQHQFYVINLEGRSSDFDVMAMDVIWIPEFAQAGWLLDLTDRLSREELEDFLDGPLEADTYKGRLYAVPWYVDAAVLYYRRDLLEKYGLSPPETVEELVSTARTVLEGEADPGLYGFIWQGKQYEGLVCAALEFIWGNGGDVLDKDDRCLLRDDRVSQALGLMYDLIQKYRVSPSLVTTADEESTRHIFGRGKALYMRNWPYAWSLFQEESSRVRGKIGITAIPSMDMRGVSTLGGWQLGINKYSRHPRASWRLIEFLTSYPSQKFLALRAGFKPTRKALYKDEELIKEQPFITELYPIITRARPRPITPFYPMISQVLQSEFSSAVNGVKTSEEAMAQAEKEINRILELERFWRQGS